MKAIIHGFLLTLAVGLPTLIILAISWGVIIPL